MQKKLNKTETRLTQSPMDKILRKRSKRKSLTKHTPIFSKHNTPKQSQYTEKNKASTKHQKKKDINSNIIQATAYKGTFIKQPTSQPSSTTPH
jgi:hypothetical protein